MHEVSHISEVTPWHLQGVSSEVSRISRQEIGELFFYASVLPAHLWRAKH